jgi:hypothetical protein
MAFQLSCDQLSVSTSGERKQPNNVALRAKPTHRSLQSVATFTAEITDGAQTNAQSTAKERRKMFKKACHEEKSGRML